MKKVLIALLVIVVLVVGAALALPLLIPAETYKAEITRRVEAATGRELVIGGDLDFSVLPTIALTAEDVRLANAPGAAADAPHMATLRALQVELKPWPLLRGEVVVDRFVLVEPEIALRVDAEGRPNWRLGTADGGDGATPQQQEGQQATAAGGDGSPALPITALRLGEVRVENGTVTYHDARSGTTERLEAVNATVSLPDLQSPLGVDGSLLYRGERVDLDLDVERPLVVIQGGPSPVRLHAAAKPVEIRFDGRFENAATPAAEGDLALDVASIRDLAAWLGDEPPAFQGEGLRTLALAGQAEAAGNDLALRNVTLRLDDIEATGEIAADLGVGPRPEITGRLDVGALDLNPYLPPAADENATAPAAAGGAAPPAAGAGEQPAAPSPTGTMAPAADTQEGGDGDGWSDEPIALPPVLGAADVDFELTVDSLRYGDVQTGPGALGLTMEGQTLRAQLKELALYDGRATGVVRIGAEGEMPAFRIRLDLAGVDALPLLRDAADFERLEGTANAGFDLTTRGLTERRLVSNLSGTGELRFEDGAIDGINLAAMVRNVQGAFLGAAAGAGEVRKTDFAELGGTFTARNGVLRNDDLTLQAPLLRLAGAGTVNLPRRRIDYRIEPLAAPTLEGQGGQADVAGLMVPVVIEGSLEDPEIRPDLSGVIDEAIRNPEELRRRIEQLGEGAEDLRRGLEELTRGDGIGRLIEGLGDGGDQEEGGDARRPPSPLDRLLSR